MRTRFLTAIALIGLMLAITACEQQVCYQEGKRERRPPMPFAEISSGLPPAIGLIRPY
ncbi:hypothetical protein [Microbulbifer aggregans]|uniref:hypothetical protein n=1 Tax=Microbulbifer aggregans TaxID=1769779 RepID=UPI001CFC696F|nr:hypothetical protein [Microbulbifer aggregans]